jgi:hypothetical protein
MGNRFVRTTSVLAITGSLMNILAGMRDDVDPELRQTLGTLSGAVGGAGALFSLLRPRPRPPPYIDPAERALTSTREMLLRDAFAETE